MSILFGLRSGSPAANSLCTTAIDWPGRAPKPRLERGQGAQYERTSSPEVPPVAGASLFLTRKRGSVKIIFLLEKPSW